MQALERQLERQKKRWWTVNRLEVCGRTI